MQVLRLTLTMISCSAVSVACSKKNQDAPAGGAHGDKGSATAPVVAGPDFASWDVGAKKKAWTGSWVAKDNGAWQAWTVTADGKVSVRDGDQDSAFELEVEIPCYAYFKNAKGFKFPHTFTVTSDGKLDTSGNGGGFRRGGEAIFCDGSGDIYVLAADGTCTAWKQDFRDWKSRAGECSLGKNAEGKDVFKHGEPNAGEFTIEGDAIGFGRNRTEAAADHEAAKMAAAAKNAAR